MRDLEKDPILVQIGQNNGYRYIGVVPPLDEAQQAKIMDLIDGSDLHVRECDDSPPYTEIGWDTDHVGFVDVADKARRIASVLGKTRDNDNRIVPGAVQIDLEVKTLGQGIHLFKS